MIPGMHLNNKRQLVHISFHKKGGKFRSPPVDGSAAHFPLCMFGYHFLYMRGVFFSLLLVVYKTTVNLSVRRLRCRFAFFRFRFDFRFKEGVLQPGGITVHLACVPG